jgi:NADH-quinone oxidoreductase subunit E
VEDDLQRIHGIGPTIAGLLRGMDITSFRQIARFEPDDVAYVAAALDAFPDRIGRDDWMSCAARLHEEKYGEPA